MPREYPPADFSSVEDYFSGFNSKDIENFHYVNLENYKSRVPGPNAYAIEGYFELSEGKWDVYMKEHSDWYEGELPKSNVPRVLEMEVFCQWLRSDSWNNKHSAKGIAGSFYLCKEKRMVFFQSFKI